jgi:phosphoribosylglycinamide formyltransferase-1
VTTMRLGFLASHRGTNMQSIIDACNQGKMDAIPAVVISNNTDSGALDRANAEQIAAYHLSSRNFPDPDDLDQAIKDTLLKHNVDIVILAGYMKKIGRYTLKEFTGRILNIHPSLLPKYGGEGMYGNNVHAAVLEAGDKETGVTVHVVTDHYDQGPILAKDTVPVLKNDTVETLAKRVLVVEHQIYVDTIKRIINGEIVL